jgi:hypothetical protein
VAIACEACGNKVHEQSVVCPHCGGHTGVTADPRAVAAIARAKPLVPRAVPDPLPVLATPAPTDTFAAAAAVGAALVGAAIDALGRQRDEPVPRAIARRRRATRRAAAGRRRSPPSR